MIWGCMTADRPGYMCKIDDGLDAELYGLFWMTSSFRPWSITACKWGTLCPSIFQLWCQHHMTYPYSH